MDKRVVIVLSDHGWTQAKIARRFKVTRTGVFHIVTRIKRLRGNLEGIRCEICRKRIEKKQYVEVEGTDSFLACDDCKEEMSA